MKKKIIIISSIVIAVIIFVIIAFNTFLLPKNNFNVIMNHIKIGDDYSKIQRYLDESKLDITKENINQNSPSYSINRENRYSYVGDFMFNNTLYHGQMMIFSNNKDKITYVHFIVFGGNKYDKNTLAYFEKRYGESIELYKGYYYWDLKNNTRLIYEDGLAICYMLHDEESQN